jgi:hypothetical protein
MPPWHFRQALKRPNSTCLKFVKNWQSSHSIKHQVDSCGIPVQSNWSVHQLLESYACSKLSSTTIDRLYELSALASPKKDTLQYEKDLEDMVKLVDAVKWIRMGGLWLDEVRKNMGIECTKFAVWRTWADTFEIRCTYGKQTYAVERKGNDNISFFKDRTHQG